MEQRFMNQLIQTFVDPIGAPIAWEHTGRFEGLLSDFFALRGQVHIRNTHTLTTAVQHLLGVVLLVLEDQLALQQLNAADPSDPPLVDVIECLQGAKSSLSGDSNHTA